MWNFLKYKISPITGKIKIITTNEFLDYSSNFIEIESFFRKLENLTQNFKQYKNYSLFKYILISMNIISILIAIILLSVSNNKSIGLILIIFGVILIFCNIIYISFFKDYYLSKLNKILKIELKNANNNFFLKNGVHISINFNPFGFILQKIPNDLNLYMLIGNYLNFPKMNKCESINSTYSTKPLFK